MRLQVFVTISPLRIGHEGEVMSLMTRYPGVVYQKIEVLLRRRFSPSFGVVVVRIGVYVGSETQGAP